MANGYSTSIGNIPSERFLSNFFYDLGVKPDAVIPQELSPDKLYGQNFDFLANLLKNRSTGMNPLLAQLQNNARQNISRFGDQARRATTENLASSGFRGSGANLFNDIFANQTQSYENLDAKYGQLGLQDQQFNVANLLGLNQFQAGQNMQEKQFNLGALFELLNMATNRANTKRQMDITENANKVDFGDAAMGILGTGIGGFAGGFGGGLGASLFGGGAGRAI